MEALITYTILGGTYLIVVPGLLMFYFKVRWFKTGSFERAFICFMAFFFFPGLILLSPFLNFRPESRKI
ncbi:MAG: NAD(P)H-quinone oxidoreductase [Cyanobacteria bacterium M5B4]|nr:MAG: NAD(P)H-quinone oxidoreductase [Cyanobacteria bacterium M5B4]